MRAAKLSTTRSYHLLGVVPDVSSFAPLPQQQADHGGVDEQEQTVPADGNPERLRSVELEQNRQPDAARGVSSGWGGRMDAWTDEWMDEWMDGRIDGWMDG